MESNRSQSLRNHIAVKIRTSHVAFVKKKLLTTRCVKYFQGFNSTTKARTTEVAIPHM